MKNKHSCEEEDMEPDHQEVKRLKFSEEEDEEEEDEEEQEVDTLDPSDSSCLSKEAEAMVQEKEKVLSEVSSSAATTEEQGMSCWSGLVFHIKPPFGGGKIFYFFVYFE